MRGIVAEPTQHACLCGDCASAEVLQGLVLVQVAGGFGDELPQHPHVSVNLPDAGIDLRKVLACMPLLLHARPRVVLCVDCVGGASCVMIPA